MFLSSDERMPPDPEQVKQWLSSRHADIASAHRSGAGGFATCSALTTTMDEVLRSTMQMVTDGARDRIAVLALGGYGRGELCPHSDVDVMVLCPSGEDRDLVNQTAKSFLHLLWDIGLTVGHSVRTIDEAMQTRGGPVD
jgi:[protein-PII] uridylyltransferase